MMLDAKKHNLLVVSGPSGVGKGTLVSALLELVPDICLSISVTTRPPRGQERHGQDYFFITPAEFTEMIASNKLLEYAYVHENYYGTPKQFVLDKIAAGADVILEIDVQGALQIKQQMPEAVLIFIAPPNLEELEKRLRTRAQDSPDAIAGRLRTSQEELKLIHEYDYLVENHCLEEALLRLKSIVIAERCKLARQYV